MTKRVQRIECPACGKTMTAGRLQRHRESYACQNARAVAAGLRVNDLRGIGKGPTKP